MMMKRDHDFLIVMNEFLWRSSDQLNVAAKRVGLTRREAFALIAIQGGQANQEHLSRFLRINRNTVVLLMDQMSINLLAYRKENEKNRREKLVELLPRGESKLKDLQGIIPEVREAVLHGLTDSEKRQFTSLVQKVVDARFAT